MATTSQPQLTIVGLGPGDKRLLTVEAQGILRRAKEVWFRTPLEVPVFLLESDKVRHFGEISMELVGVVEVVGIITSRLIELARLPGGVVFAVPGNPSPADALIARLWSAAEAANVRLKSVVALSDIDILMASATPPLGGLQVLEAAGIAARVREEPGETLPWPKLLSPSLLVATAPVLVRGLTREEAQPVQEFLLEAYPPTHQAILLAEGTSIAGGRCVRMDALAKEVEVYGRVSLYVPPLTLLDDLYSFSTFRHIVARLRAPGGCPWDREQTHESLKPYLVEECYEVLEALDEADLAKLEEELGDLLLQIVLHAQLAAETGTFSMKNVLAHISAKLIRRHPHVFGDRVVADSSEVVRNWEAIKRAEKGPKATPSLLGGVPKQMPALAHSFSIQRRVADVGFDWRDTADAMGKVVEELGELERATTPNERLLEFGDLLFAMVSAGRRLGVDAEEALRLANARFMRRFARLEDVARARSVSLKDLSSQQLGSLWREAKPRD